MLIILLATAFFLVMVFAVIDEKRRAALDRMAAPPLPVPRKPKGLGLLKSDGSHM